MIHLELVFAFIRQLTVSLNSNNDKGKILSIFCSLYNRKAYGEVKVNFHAFNLFTWVFLFYIMTLAGTQHRIERLGDNEEGLVNWIGSERKWLWPNLMYYPEICFERLKHKYPIQNSRSRESREAASE